MLRQSDELEVVGLFTTLTEGLERVAMQGIRRDVLHAQARATGLPVIESWLPQHADNVTYESAFASSLERARKRWPGLCDIAFGDLFLEDIKAYRDDLCGRLGWAAHYPLFGSETGLIAREMIAGGLRAQLCCVDTTQLDACFAGHAFDAALLDALPETVDPCGERGEFHTCVIDGPMFNVPLEIARGDTVRHDNRFAYTDFLTA